MGICIGETRQDRLKMKTLMVSLVVLGLSAADFVGLDAEQLARAGRQDDGAIQGGIDFSGCTEDAETGLCCVEKEEEVTTLKKEPILECTHKNVEQCHYTYVTKFKPSQQQVFNETVRKCYKPIEKVCNGQGKEICQTVYESSCSTKYVEKQPGKFVGDTSCEKLPVEICGAGCTLEEGE